MDSPLDPLYKLLSCLVHNIHLAFKQSLISHKIQDFTFFYLRFSPGLL